MRYAYWLGTIMMLAACGGSFGTDTDAADTNLEGNLPIVLEAGVPLALAQARAERLSDINYELLFRVPETASEPIQAEEVLTFQLEDTDGGLQLDFREAGDKLKSLRINGQDQAVIYRNEHILLPEEVLQRGANTVEISFVAGDTSLNRNPDYLYTLFVPDRARTAFPLFDQPNLKATYDLTLDLPAHWEAISNGPVERVEAPAPGAPGSDRKRHQFARTDRLSSYLFSFVAGEFQTVTRTLNGREMTFLHRETDPDKVAHNMEEIFELHADALAWLEDYTGIDYPFQKFDFAAIPTFQYGGMEHVGAIQYRASTLFLDDNPSTPQLLNRANLIAHETAHMWFGDLVTMDWFNDVWTKEVFANFMAAKMVNPSFPEINHDLNFLLRSYPAAYAVDRTTGANPIRQPLPNLNEAGTLYGGIIYNKAPIMMQQLEMLIGEDVFQDGIREYLTTFAGGNATWPELIEILDKRSEKDLTAWSEVWVNTPGRPEIRFNADGQTLRMVDPAGQGRVWPQAFTVTSASRPDTTASVSIEGRSAAIPEAAAGADFVNATGEGYGLFPVPNGILEQSWRRFSDLQTGTLLTNLYEQMLEGHEAVPPAAYFRLLLREADEERNELLLNTMLGQMRRIYWSFLSVDEQNSVRADMEQMLWRGVTSAGLPASTRKIHFRTLQDVATSEDSLDRLERILADGSGGTRRLNLSLREQGQLVLLLAIKRPDTANVLLEAHLSSIESADEKRRFAFLMPAASADPQVRDMFFASLSDVENRAIESWVVDAFTYLHHPLRVEQSIAYLEKSLDLMEEIQVTGDIFFPARWASGALQNHRSPQAAETVRTFLQDRPDYNAQLRLKILQAADMVFRAEALAGSL